MIQRYFARARRCFRDNRTEILRQNWTQVRVMTFVYLGFLAAYGLAAALPMGNAVQNKTVWAAVAAQLAYSLCVTLKKKPPAHIAAEYAWLLIFGMMIVGPAIFLGTFVFREGGAWLFPLELILLTQIYTMPPLEKCIELPLYTAAFLTCSFLFKSPEWFWQDVLSAFMALGIAMVSYFTLTWYKIESFQDKAALQQMCSVDAMTGLLNKTTFVHLCGASLRSRAPRQSYALAVLDIDHFKKVNDQHGHIRGDDALTLLAEQMRRRFPAAQGYILGRFGGDEFLVFIPHAERDALAKELESFLAELRARSAEQLGMTLTASAGAVVTAKDGVPFEQLFEKADAQLYAAKAGGGAAARIADLTAAQGNFPLRKGAR